VPLEIRQLIREISLANPLWGAPRIHGELLKLGIAVGQTSVAKYMARRRRPPSQGWRTFLRNHADGIAAMDLFVVPTISFRLLYGLLILRHDRRRLLWLETTTHPTAEWIARQLTEACGWDEARHRLFRRGDADRKSEGPASLSLRGRCAAGRGSAATIPEEILDATRYGRMAGRQAGRSAHRIGFALAVILALLAVILAFIAAAWRQDRMGAWLFAPYAVWVAFASVLNASIFALN
jgi:hypothetical protein